MTEADLDAVVRIQDECYTSIVAESRGSLRAKLQASPATCLVAVVAARVVGYVLAVPVRYPHLPELDAPAWDSPPDADALYLHDLAVAGVGRGSGAGAALVGRILAAASDGGWSRACLVAIQDSASYWSRYGFSMAPEDDAPCKLASYGDDARLMYRT